MSEPSVESTELVTRVGHELTRRQITLALAESCTGGLLAARLTGREGASAYFLAGFVTYSNAAKEALLGVPAEAITTAGAVSEEVARAMAAGARSRTGADAAIAVTGIAGPGGGTPTKPVGTVWICATLEERVDVRRFQFGGGRDAVRVASVDAALDMMRTLLEEA